MRARTQQRGSVLVEFTIAGIAGVTLMVTTIQLGLAMWHYHTLAQAVHETNRYIASHGRSCASGGNNCTITVGDIATKLKSNAIGISASSLNMTLTSQSGTTIDCNPISWHESDTTQWPPAAGFDNNPGNSTKISASTTINSGIILLWYGMTGQRKGSITLRSTSNVPIVF